MRNLLGSAAGERLDLDDYYADFEKNFWTITELGFWKLERQRLQQGCRERWRVGAVAPRSCRSTDPPMHIHTVHGWSFRLRVSTG